MGSILKTSQITLIFSIISVVSCKNSSPSSSTETRVIPWIDSGLRLGSAEPVRFIFDRDSFSHADESESSGQPCVGNAVKMYAVQGADYASAPSVRTTIPFGASTTRWIKAVSVDQTRTYDPIPTTAQPFDGCSFRGSSPSVASSDCVRFSANSPHFFTVDDTLCTGQGPVQSADPALTRANIGHVYLDFDRTRLNEVTDILVLITYYAYDGQSAGLLTTTPLMDHTTNLALRLERTQSSLDDLQNQAQPRAWANEQTTLISRQLPQFRGGPPGLRTESVVVPLSQYPEADRLRLYRERGSYHLYQIDVYPLDRAD